MRPPRRSKAASGTNNRSGSTSAALRRRFGDIHGAQQNSVAGLPEAEDQRLTTRPGDGQSGQQSPLRRGRQGAAKCPARRASDERPIRFSARPCLANLQALLGQPLGKRLANFGGRSSRRRSSASALRRALASDRQICRGVGVIPGTKARSRESRWTVIPGAYVSRWAPCTQAHGQGQGQLPLGSYGPEEFVLTHPPAPQPPI